MLALVQQLFGDDGTITNNNLLPTGGEVIYLGKIFTELEANNFSEKLFNSIEWKNDEAIIFGKKIITKRKAAWYGDSNYAYTYSKSTKYAMPWTDELLQIKKIVETKADCTFNSCLLNLYHNGSEAMAWHSDDEKELQKNGCIASVSFGAERKFMFKHKQSKNTVSILLQNGSVLLMKKDTQKNWLHRLTTSTKIHTYRINLTFRTMETQGEQ